MHVKCSLQQLFCPIASQPPDLVFICWPCSFYILGVASMNSVNKPPAMIHSVVSVAKCGQSSLVGSPFVTQNGWFLANMFWYYWNQMISWPLFNKPQNWSSSITLNGQDTKDPLFSSPCFANSSSSILKKKKTFNKCLAFSFPVRSVVLTPLHFCLWWQIKYSR